MNYFIADTHFGHESCLRFDNRPFENIEEMNQTIMDNWNRKVKPDDDVWIIGDFCYRSSQEPTYFLRKLNGKKHFIIGNHDKAILESKQALRCFESVENMAYVKDNGKNLILCHFPIAEWNGMRRGALHIYGHIHANRDEVSEFMERNSNAFNAGCMINNYEPVTLEELIENNQKFKMESGQSEGYSLDNTE